MSSAYDIDDPVPLLAKLKIFLEDPIFFIDSVVAEFTVVKHWYELLPASWQKFNVARGYAAFTFSILSYFVLSILLGWLGFGAEDEGDGGVVSKSTSKPMSNGSQSLKAGGAKEEVLEAVEKLRGGMHLVPGAVSAAAVYIRSDKALREKLAEEISTVGRGKGKKASISSGSEYESLKKLPLLTAVVNESLRISTLPNSNSATSKFNINLQTGNGSGSPGKTRSGKVPRETPQAVVEVDEKALAVVYAAVAAVVREGGKKGKGWRWVEGVGSGSG